MLPCTKDTLPFCILINYSWENLVVGKSMGWQGRSSMAWWICGWNYPVDWMELLGCLSEVEIAFCRCGCIPWFTNMLSCYIYGLWAFDMRLRWMKYVRWIRMCFLSVNRFYNLFMLQKNPIIQEKNGQFFFTLSMLLCLSCCQPLKEPWHKYTSKWMLITMLLGFWPIMCCWWTRSTSRLAIDRMS